MHKIAATESQAWEMQETYEAKPHGWIQWKGTDVCMDVHCKCGTMAHVDATFAYYVKCPNCETVFMCNGHIEFIEVEKVESDNIITAAP